PELHAVAEVAVDVVDDRLPVEALILVVAGRGRVDPAPDHPVPVEGVAERRVDLGARREPGLAAGAVGPLPESEDEDRPVLQPARDEPRRVLRLRAVEEEADLVPVDEFEALVGERIELLWIDPSVLGGREAVEVE